MTKYSTIIHINAWDKYGRRSEYRLCKRDDQFGDVDLFFNAMPLELGLWSHSDAYRIAEDHARKLGLTFDYLQFDNGLLCAV